MDLTQILTSLSIVAIVATGATFFIRYASKKISFIAIKEIKKAQEAYEVHRDAEMGKLEKRISDLEIRDTSKQLTITKIEVTLENLVHSHETTQSMIADTTTKLIDLLQERGKS
jgi:uncharacterized coiled-coil protein SlyX